MADSSFRDRAVTPGPVQEKLLTVALRLVSRSGFDSVPVSEIASAAGVAKGTFFNHFPTKEHLLTEALHRMVSEALGEIAGRRGSGTEAILAFGEVVAERLARDRSLAEALVPRFVGLPRLRADEPRETERIRRWIEDRLEEALPVRVPIREIDPASLSSLLVWTIRGSLEEWVEEGGTLRQLRQSMSGKLGFLLESAGFPASLEKG